MFSPLWPVVRLTSGILFLVLSFLVTPSSSVSGGIQVLPFFSCYLKREDLCGSFHSKAGRSFLEIYPTDLFKNHG